MAADVEAARIAGSGYMPSRGALAVTVPGAISGWAALHEQGAILPWADAFSRAIALAYDGVEAPRGLVAALASNNGLLSADPGMARIFFPGGAPLGLGRLFSQPALGATLQALADRGASVFYEGDVGRRFIAGLRSAGSPMTSEDLASHGADLVSPMRASYRDLDVSVVPPNSQGFVLLQILTMIERLELDPDPFGRDVAALALTMRAAAVDRDRHLADADRMRVHPYTLLEDGHIASLCDQVRAGDVRPPDSPSQKGGADTIGLVTADSSGNAVSLIQSLYEGFGSGILEPETGIVAHNRGACFSLQPGHPNELTPGARPAHTLMPVMVQRAGRAAYVSGTMGGHAQAQINAMILARAIDLGSTPAEAIAAPRWLSSGLEPEELEAFVTAESDVPLEAVEALKGAGFTIRSLPSLSSSTGHAHMIRIAQPGTGGRLEAGSDPRADGGALAS
jgi:gamma-glutamyltranspeptidase/glutathione hydrolase